MIASVLGCTLTLRYTLYGVMVVVVCATCLCSFRNVNNGICQAENKIWKLCFNLEVTSKFSASYKLLSYMRWWILLEASPSPIDSKNNFK